MPVEGRLLPQVVLAHPVDVYYPGLIIAGDDGGGTGASAFEVDSRPVHSIDVRRYGLTHSIPGGPRAVCFCPHSKSRHPSPLLYSYPDFCPCFPSPYGVLPCEPNWTSKGRALWHLHHMHRFLFMRPPFQNRFKTSSNFSLQKPKPKQKRWAVEVSQTQT